MHCHLFLHTKYIRAGGIFSGHANYHNARPWYDWVMLSWACEDNQHYTSDANCQAASSDDEMIAAAHLLYDATNEILGFVCASTPVDWMINEERPHRDGVRQ
jgi:hypothetical protein